jgi:enoyl-CoA hydratase/carnithine racemase
VHEVGAAELLEALRTGSAVETFADVDGGAVVVPVTPTEAEPTDADIDALTSLPFVVTVVTDPGEAGRPSVPGLSDRWSTLADVVIERGDPSLDDVLALMTAHPRAAVALTLLLRGQSRRSIGDGLVAESATYSMLQDGPEFEAWRASRPIRTRNPEVEDHPRVRVELVGDRLMITLTRPLVRNAFDRRMRDELLDALRIAELDHGIGRVEVRGEGASFCSGGDLDEFGSRSDPATAHLIRLHRNASRVLASLRDRTTVYLHGACAGSGVEMAAFAGHVVADPGTTFVLPEISLGLIPGAGGTVSLPARIGRHRTAWMALSGRTVDADTALTWGLVDEVAPVAHS